MPCLQLARFGDVALIWRFDLRDLVEQWWSETQTFIMSCKECTITLEDVAMQLGLRVEGDGSKIHLKYLPLLENFHCAGTYSWGSTVLVILYRDLCRATKHRFLWMSYFALNVAILIPQWVHAKAYVWCINMLVFNFSTIEWYNADRVMRSFVPVNPQQFTNVHSKSMRGKDGAD
ncbi:hypothetical protein J1N35_008201 [Gossypium stocksii]|uniref:Aminotransferase-like plant mobile domain-containing protein n=1 Tax=Gossypium stocksii TaxID=47602 RepID=A0A9D4AG91_9ROSI|nr:hypothetical protein J1N35_008201 [Gossypium stocksii]